ncbi:hypothetical protein SKAU_G00302700 [Synaphobranchus kaupii]|uniref:Uncharacterized protein n=1 Tax=Synaphobranchus kaupii TaxID=118154 RepID=A0A9Q1IMG5_SYNKA|nr:hypothetical protein SKAU_G00302700 [Synaphobranchus kaupii]
MDLFPCREKIAFWDNEDPMARPRLPPVIYICRNSPVKSSPPSSAPSALLRLLLRCRDPRPAPHPVSARPGRRSSSSPGIWQRCS